MLLHFSKLSGNASAADSVDNTSSMKTVHSRLAMKCPMQTSTISQPYLQSYRQSTQDTENPEDGRKLDSCITDWRSSAPWSCLTYEAL